MNRFLWLIALIITFQIPVATAHTLWLEPAAQENTYDVLFGGHAGKLEPLQHEKLQLIQAYDRNGKVLPMERRDSSDSSQLQLQPDTVLVAIYYDNGIWTKDKMGKSINKSMTQVPGANKATRAVKYHKTVVQWSEQVSKTIGQEFEVIPLSSDQPVAGKAMSVKVLLNGTPLAGVKLGHGEIGEAGETNAQGIAEFIPQAGFNKLWAGKRFQVAEQEYTEMSYEYLFGFHAAEQK